MLSRELNVLPGLGSILPMASTSLNKWIVSGNLGADAQIKTVELKSGEQAQLAETTLYVRKPRDRKESFIVRLTIWSKSSAWRMLPYLKKGSVVICTGNVEPNPYISSNGNLPKAGLEMTVLDIDLDIVRQSDDTEAVEAAEPIEAEAKELATA
jgi:single-strand DNA-binding protein